MKTTYAFILLASIILSCNSIKSITAKEGHFPLVGTIGKERNTVLKTHFMPIGHPILENHIALSIQVIPFTPKSFGTYEHMREQLGLNTSVQFVDSLKSKPTFTSFEINDRIGLKEALNNADNLRTKSYLEKDQGCRLVSRMSVVLDNTYTAMLSDADGVFLLTDNDGLLWIETIHNNKRNKLSIPKNQIFDYDLIGVCWGENIVGKSIIETFNDNGRCPEGTERNPSKLDETYSLLKL